MHCSYKFRLYPNQKQKNLIEKTFGCCRFVFNHYLEKRNKLYNEKGQKMGYYASTKDLTVLKKSLPWLYEVNASALYYSLRHLDDAYKNFFRRVKNGEKPGYPKFKSKHAHQQSYTCKGCIKVFDNHIQIPSLGKIKCRIGKKVEGHIQSATIRKTSAGNYFVSLCCTNAEIPALTKTGKSIGLDMGIKSFAVTSNGEVFENPKYFSKSEKKLAKLQKNMSRKIKGSANWNKARIKIAKLYEHITNQRLDMQHKLSTELIRQNDIICIENLDIKNMIQNHQYAKSITDASWYEFHRQLTYKAERYKKRLVVIDRFFPSSQICSECDTQWPTTKDLNVRQWTCPNCGANLERDINAAINILREGLRLLA